MIHFSSIFFIASPSLLLLDYMRSRRGGGDAALLRVVIDIDIDI